MKSAELMFEYNFLSSSNKSDSLEKLYVAADTIKTAMDTLSNCESDYSGVSYGDAVERLASTMAAVQITQAHIDNLQKNLNHYKEHLKQCKNMLKSISDPMPKKSVSSVKKILENKNAFLDSLDESGVDLAKLPTLAEIAEFLKKMDQ